MAAVYSVKTFVQFPSLSCIFYITLFLSGSVFVCVLHVHVLCGVYTACAGCLVNHCGTSYLCHFWVPVSSEEGTVVKRFVPRAMKSDWIDHYTEVLCSWARPARNSYSFPRNLGVKKGSAVLLGQPEKEQKLGDVHCNSVLALRVY